MTLFWKIKQKEWIWGEGKKGKKTALAFNSGVHLAETHTVLLPGRML